MLTAIQTLWQVPAGTPDQDQSLFEEILVECTAFQLAGALSPEAIEEAINAVTQSLLSDGSSSSEASTPHAAGSTARTPATAAAIQAVMAEQQQAQQAAPPSSSQPVQPDAPLDGRAQAHPAADDSLNSASAGQLIAEGALPSAQGGSGMLRWQEKPFFSTRSQHHGVHLHAQARRE